ncbi:TPA: nuclear transport factor 2 family protein [Raoultella planticola]
MKKLLSTVVFALAFSGNALASSAEVAAVNQAVEQMRLAMLSADKAGLEKIGAPGLSYGHSNGRLENNAQFVAAIASGKSSFQSITLRDQTVSVEDDVAIVRHQFDAQTKQGDIHIGVLQVWKKGQTEGWKLLARQAYKLP